MSEITPDLRVWLDYLKAIEAALKERGFSPAKAAELVESDMDWLCEMHLFSETPADCARILAEEEQA